MHSIIAPKDSIVPAAFRLPLIRLKGKKADRGRDPKDGCHDESEGTEHSCCCEFLGFIVHFSSVPE